MDEKKTAWASLRKFLQHYRDHFVYHVITWPCVALLFAFVKASTNSLSGLSNLVQWASENPWRALTYTLIVTVLAYLVVVVLIHLWRRSSQLLAAYKTIRNVGIEAFWPQQNPDSPQPGWEDCVAKIATEAPSELCILGLTGAATFAHSQSPLRNAVEKHQGSILILLIDPTSRAFEQRVRELGHSDLHSEVDLNNRFIGEIEDTLAFCRTLARKSVTELRRIEVRAYDLPAIWKMVIFGDYLWLQQYAPRVHVEQSSAVMFHKRVESSMYYPLERVFYNRWALGKEKIWLKRHEDGKLTDAVPTWSRR